MLKCSPRRSCAVEIVWLSEADGLNPLPVPTKGAQFVVTSKAEVSPNVGRLGPGKIASAFSWLGLFGKITFA